MASQASSIQRSSWHDFIPVKDETSSKEFACCLIALNTISNLSQAELAEIRSFEAIKRKAATLNVQIDNAIENCALLFPGIDVNKVKGIFCRPEFECPLSDDPPSSLLTDASKALIKQTVSSKAITMSMLSSTHMYLNNYVKIVASDLTLREKLGRPIADQNKTSMMQFFNYVSVVSATMKIGFLENLFLQQINDEISCLDIAQGLKGLGFSFDTEAYRGDPSYRDKVIAEIKREI